MMRGIEKRKMERFDLELPAKIQVLKKGFEEIDSKTGDISSGGAFFYTKETLPIGTSVLIDLILDLDELKKIKSKNAKISLEGLVVRSDSKGIAVKFSEQYGISSF